jgi:hypothetical protein
MVERNLSVDHVTIGAGSRDTLRSYTAAAARNCG